MNNKHETKMLNRTTKQHSMSKKKPHIQDADNVHNMYSKWGKRR